jgi:hypothetical protein
MEESNGIKPEKLIKVDRLLAALHESIESRKPDIGWDGREHAAGENKNDSRYCE